MAKRTRTISITSGKGGVGKTTMISNIALSLANQGKCVLILDGDLGMANVDIMFGVRPQRTIYDLLSGECELSEVMTQISPNLYLIPAGNGIVELQNLSSAQKRAILDQVSELDMGFDYMLIDTAPGIDDNVLYLNSAAQEIHVIITPDPASIADSYALIKVLNRLHHEEKFKILCNQVKDEAEGLALYGRFADVVNRFLYVSLDYQGCIPFDLNLRQAVRAQKLIISTQPQSVSAQAVQKIARKISGYREVEEMKGGLQFFWEHLVGVA
jgi:flagellar biosynthesis protein FlhG